MTERSAWPTRCQVRSRRQRAPGDICHCKTDWEMMTDDGILITIRPTERRWWATVYQLRNAHAMVRLRYNWLSSNGRSSSAFQKAWTRFSRTLLPCAAALPAVLEYTARCLRDNVSQCFRAVFEFSDDSKNPVIYDAMLQLGSLQERYINAASRLK